MPPAKFSGVLIGTLLVSYSVQAQPSDSTKTIISKINSSEGKVKWQNTKNGNSLQVSSLLVPGIMIAYGFTALENDPLEELNEEIKEQVYVEHPHNQFHLDNYLQFAPAVAVYCLNAMGIKGKHNFRDRSMIFVMSNIILTGTIYSLKSITAEQRPDGSSYTSFPSGHTAEAFASAEFLYQEYKHRSLWYGIAGYAAAITTGYLRLYNNKHWFSDVVAGAGVGIMSTKISYWLYPKIRRSLFKDKPVNTMIMPCYQDGSLGVGMVHVF